MIIKASGKYLRGSPRKARLVADEIKGLSVEGAIAKLKLIDKRSATAILKIVQQGLANAKNNLKIANAEKIRISQVFVDEGPRMKRQDKSHGARFDSGIIRKRFYHFKIILETKEEKAPSLPVPSGTEKQKSRIKSGK